MINNKCFTEEWVDQFKKQKVYKGIDKIILLLVPNREIIGQRKSIIQELIKGSLPEGQRGKWAATNDDFQVTGELVQQESGCFLANNTSMAVNLDKKVAWLIE